MVDIMATKSYSGSSILTKEMTVVKNHIMEKIAENLSELAAKLLFDKFSMESTSDSIKIFCQHIFDELKPLAKFAVDEEEYIILFDKIEWQIRQCSPTNVKEWPVSQFRKEMIRNLAESTANFHPNLIKYWYEKTPDLVMSTVARVIFDIGLSDELTVAQKMTQYLMAKFISFNELTVSIEEELKLLIIEKKKEYELLHEQNMLKITASMGRINWLIHTKK